MDALSNGMTVTAIVDRLDDLKDEVESDGDSALVACLKMMIAFSMSGPGDKVFNKALVDFRKVRKDSKKEDKREPRGLRSSMYKLLEAVGLMAETAIFHWTMRQPLLPEVGTQQPLELFREVEEEEELLEDRRTLAVKEEPVDEAFDALDMENDAQIDGPGKRPLKENPNESLEEQGEQRQLPTDTRPLTRVPPILARSAGKSRGEALPTTAMDQQPTTSEEVPAAAPPTEEPTMDSVASEEWTSARAGEPTSSEKQGTSQPMEPSSETTSRRMEGEDAEVSGRKTRLPAPAMDRTGSSTQEHEAIVFNPLKVKQEHVQPVVYPEGRTVWTRPKDLPPTPAVPLIQAAARVMAGQGNAPVPFPCQNPLRTAMLHPRPRPPPPMPAAVLPARAPPIALKLQNPPSPPARAAHPMPSTVRLLPPGAAVVNQRFEAPHAPHATAAGRDDGEMAHQQYGERIVRTDEVAMRHSAGAGMQETGTSSRRSETDLGARMHPAFPEMVTAAIESSPTGEMAVKEIYAHIVTHHPIFRNAKPTWKNSVRHALSSTAKFKKTEVDPRTDIKGRKKCVWSIESEYRKKARSDESAAPRCLQQPPAILSRKRCEPIPSASQTVPMKRPYPQGLRPMYSIPRPPHFGERASHMQYPYHALHTPVIWPNKF